MVTIPDAKEKVFFVEHPLLLQHQGNILVSPVYH